MIAALLVAAGTFMATVPWGEYLIRWLQRNGIGKHIRVDGPRGHEVKRGTPTMGGILIVAPVLLIGGLLALSDRRLWAPIAVTAAFAGLGAVDDLRGLRDTKGVGWLARNKFPWQLVVGSLGALVLYLVGAPRVVTVPIAHWSIDLGAAYLPVAAFIIVAMANAVNFNDGLDGLAGGTVILAFVAYGVIALTALETDAALALLCAVFVGALGAFLCYNVHPARVFMGDTGALALGAGLASIALLTQHWVLLPLIGAIFVAEVASVIMQVAYFKLTHGRRIFRMAPLHCHFEVCGWPETRIVLHSWILAALLAMVGVALAVLR